MGCQASPNPEKMLSVDSDCPGAEAIWQGTLLQWPFHFTAKEHSGTGGWTAMRERDRTAMRQTWPWTSVSGRCLTRVRKMKKASKAQVSSLKGRLCLHPESMQSNRLSSVPVLNPVDTHCLKTHEQIMAILLSLLKAPRKHLFTCLFTHSTPIQCGPLKRQGSWGENAFLWFVIHGVHSTIGTLLDSTWEKNKQATEDRRTTKAWKPLWNSEVDACSWERGKWERPVSFLSWKLGNNA